MFDGYEWRGVRRGKSLVWRRGAAVPGVPSEAKVTRAVGELGPISAIPDEVASAWSVIDSRGLSRDLYIVALFSDAFRCGCHGATFDAVTGVSLGGPGGLALTRAIK